ncbi:MAG: hypothetical protein R2825_29155 [Saprospiraceae bacterium]
MTGTSARASTIGRRSEKIRVGYDLHQEVQFEDIPEDKPVFIEGLGYRHGLKNFCLFESKRQGITCRNMQLRQHERCTGYGGTVGFKLKGKIIHLDT